MMNSGYQRKSSEAPVAPAPEEEDSSRMPMSFVSTGPCWVCGGARLDRVWRDPFDLSVLPWFGPYAHAGHAPTWIVCCRDCGFGQPETLPTTHDFFDLLYAMKWSTESLDKEFDLGYKDLIFEVVLKGLERRKPAGLPKTLLDVGTHVGRFVWLARQAGWEAEGAELNPVTARYAVDRTGATIHHCRAQDLASQGRRYAAVALNDVLEHIPRPVEVLAGLRPLLHPGGVLAVKVPNGPRQRFKEGIRRWILRRPDAGVAVRLVHVNHFTAGSLRKCLEAAGYQGVTIEVAAPDFIPAAFAGRTRSQARSAFLRNTAYRIAHSLPGGVHTPLAFNLQAFAINPTEPLG
jgi:hypothetical protein